MGRVVSFVSLTILVLCGAVSLADAPASQPADPNSLVGVVAPDFKLVGVDGASHALADAKGHVLVLDFWGVWCVPCHLALPHLDAIYHAQSSSGLMVFAVDNGDEKDGVQKFLAANKLTLPVLLDPDSVASNAYKVDQYPQTVVVGKDGKVKWVNVGFDEKTSPAELEKAVAQALNQQ